jgi:hypothetical protein
MLAAAIQQAIRAGDYFRRPTLRVAGRDPLHKEWLHFCCTTRELDVLINLSVSPSSGREVPRLVCAVHDEVWRGDIDSFAAHEMTVSANSPDIRLGASSVRFDGERYLLDVKLRKFPISARLVLTPTTIPSQGNNIELFAGRRIHWFLIPHLRADGEVRIGDKVFVLRAAPAYHDHNWGDFAWGGTCCWEWGYGHGHAAGIEWSLIFARLTNLARTSDLARGLVLWKDGRQERVFEEEQISVHAHGSFRPRRLFRLPRSASLYHPTLALDVPERFELRARNGADTLDFTFMSQDIFQVVIPNEDDLGSTVINEVCGPLRVHGSLRGRSFTFETRTMFEFLHA